MLGKRNDFKWLRSDGTEKIIYTIYFTNSCFQCLSFSRPIMSLQQSGIEIEDLILNAQHFLGKLSTLNVAVYYQKSLYS